HRVGGNHDGRGGLVDRVGDRRTADAVIVGAAEAPGVAGVRARVSVRRVAYVDAADGGPRLAVDAGDRRDGRRVWTAVVRHRVGSDHDRGGGLVDRVGDRRASDVVEFGGGGEVPRAADRRSGV